MKKRNTSLHLPALCLWKMRRGNGGVGGIISKNHEETSRKVRGESFRNSKSSRNLVPSITYDNEGEIGLSKNGLNELTLTVLLTIHFIIVKLKYE